MIQDERYLCFNLGKEEFAISLLSVREVIGIPEVTPIPQMPSHFIGIMNLRGSVISIMDLRIKMGIKPGSQEEACVVILDLGEFYMGVIVDRVNSVSRIPQESVAEKPQMENSKISQAIAGVWQKEDKLVLLLDVAKALSLEERTVASRSIAS